jgi:hypothetical protein
MDSQNISAKFLPIYVPEHLYIQVFDFARGLMKEAPSILPPSPPLQPLINGFTAEEIRELRRMLHMDVHDAATAAFDLACSKPGKPVLFEDACHHSGRTFGEGRGDLIRMTKMIRKKWGKDRGWPLTYKQEGTKGVYYASQELADAWRNAAE